MSRQLGQPFAAGSTFYIAAHSFLHRSRAPNRSMSDLDIEGQIFEIDRFELSAGLLF